MSYCVNCGVELDRTAVRCVLCGTPVINPNCPPDPTAQTPYPVEKESVRLIYYRFSSIIISIILVCIDLVCFVLNLVTNAMLDTSVMWGYVVFGASVVLWTFINPRLLKPDLSLYLYVLMQTASISGLMFTISMVIGKYEWAYSLALPITGILAFHFCAGIFIIRRFLKGVFTRTALIFGCIGSFSVCVELLLREFLFRSFSVSWSGIVCVCCASVTIVLIGVSNSVFWKQEAKKRLRM